jgi:NADH-quinone oxidoreductase subunit G
MVEIEIDGNKVEVQEGSMVMDAANKVGTYIPHFCYHKKLSIAANCRMCLVEVEKAPKPLPACATPVSAGMVVRTNSEKAITAQKGVMEFLLINHPLDCPICDQGGECQLQDLAVGYGKSESRYAEDKRIVVPKDAGPLISMREMARCIHCTRCVRFGQEVAGVMEFGMLNRGEHAEITTFVGNTVDSELSGNMIDLCPVGALTSKPFRYTARTWELSRRKSISPHDGLGSNLIVQVKGGKVKRVLPFENDSVNECWLSDRDRFSYEGLDSPDRLTAPMLKQNGQWIEVDWQTALEYVAHGLRNIRHEHGADAIAALAAPHSTLEELHLLQKLVRGMGSENIDFRLRQSDFRLSGSVVPWLGMPIAELGTLDRVLVVGSFLRTEQPLIAARLRQAAKRGGQVSVLHATNEDLLMPLASKWIVAPSGWLASLNQIVAAVARLGGFEHPAGFGGVEPSDEAKTIASSLMSGNAKAILLGHAAAQYPEASRLHAAVEWLAQHTSARFGYLTEAANTVGGYIAKAFPANGANARTIVEQPRKAYMLMNVEGELDYQNPSALARALGQAEMVVSLSSYRHGEAYADVMLPIAPFTETAGTFVNCEGRAQSFNGAVKPLGETRPAWKVLRVLGNLLSLEGFDYDSAESIRKEVIGSEAAGEADLSSHVSNASNLAPEYERPEASNGSLERIADVPIYSTDSIVRRSPPLQQTTLARPPVAVVSVALANRLGIVDGDQVNVRQGDAAATLAARVDAGMLENVVRVSAAHPVTATLGPMFGPIAVENV